MVTTYRGPLSSSVMTAFLVCDETGPPKRSLDGAPSRLFFHRLHIQTLPQIPARDRAIGHPRLRDLLYHCGLWPLAFLVVLLDGSLHAVIAGRGLLGEIAQIRRLLSGQPDAAHLGIGQFENARRRQRIAGKRGESIEDG